VAVSFLGLRSRVSYAATDGSGQSIASDASRRVVSDATASVSLAVAGCSSDFRDVVFSGLSRLQDHGFGGRSGRGPTQ
jgi:hypothetical protein